MNTTQVVFVDNNSDDVIIDGRKHVTTFDTFLPLDRDLPASGTLQRRADAQSKPETEAIYMNAKNPFDTYIVPRETKAKAKVGFLENDVTGENMKMKADEPQNGGVTSQMKYFSPVTRTVLETGFTNPIYNPTSTDDVSNSFPSPPPLYRDTSASGSSEKSGLVTLNDLPSPIDDGEVVVLNDLNNPTHVKNASIFVAPPYPAEFVVPQEYSSALSPNDSQSSSSSNASHKTPRRLPRYNLDDAVEENSASIPRGWIQLNDKSSAPSHSPVTQADSDSSFSLAHREILNRHPSLLKEVRTLDEWRPDEVIDVSLRKQDSARNSPRGTPSLPRSTPFLQNRF